ncbi:universal stress protein UspA [Caulobacter zeae]|uniref:Universal stress protein UspA n=1 Tax=Caulobacter zeae TaxID=2055137 RepID=A0A2N5DRE8_9CAUL|nr:universal stress protein [Caulobacter zeae]PLR28621.1 universal stress protein UspA [Caulobacter zeae]
MKNILLLVHEDAGQEARLQAALDLARGLEGHIRCADITPLTIIPADGGWATGLALAEERQLQFDLRERLEVRLAAEGVSYDWIDDIGDIALRLADHSRLSDLIVFNCKRPRLFDRDTRGLVGDLVVEARCPVVAVPDAAVGLDVFGPALVAWDGSEPAAAALRSAVPLLKLARSVRLLAVGRTLKGPSPQEAAAYLSRHGVHAKVSVIEPGEEAADFHLLDQANADRAGYCVMGAYGHSRLNETLFGGVTRRMIEAAQLPLVLAR